MNYVFLTMNKEYPNEIVYNGVYSIYDMCTDEDDLNEILY